MQLITDDDVHRHDRPIVQDVCAPGIEFLDPTTAPVRIDRYAAPASGETDTARSRA